MKFYQKMHTFEIFKKSFTRPLDNRKRKLHAKFQPFSTENKARRAKVVCPARSIITLIHSGGHIWPIPARSVVNACDSWLMRSLIKIASQVLTADRFFLINSNKK